MSLAETLDITKIGESVAVWNGACLQTPPQVIPVGCGNWIVIVIPFVFFHDQPGCFAAGEVGTVHDMNGSRNFQFFEFRNHRADFSIEEETDTGKAFHEIVCAEQCPPLEISVVPPGAAA